MTDHGRTFEQTRSPGAGEPDPEGIENNREWLIKQHQRPYEDEQRRDWIEKTINAWMDARRER